MTSKKNFTVQNFDFVRFHCILLTISFTFFNFESIVQQFGLIWTSSKFGNFGLGNGDR